MQPADPPIRLDPAIRNQTDRALAGLRAAIAEGGLEPGAKLPSTRALAERLGVRRNAVVAAYEHLLNEGLIETRRGAGSFVAARLPGPAVSAAAAPVALHPAAMPPAAAPWRPFALGYAHPDPAMLNRLATRLRRRMATANAADAGYGDPRGGAHLRRQIARHLAANRGVRCDPDCVFLTAGTQHGLRLCADALIAPDARPGARQGAEVWVEDPGYFAAHATLRAAGLTPVAVAVDDEGLDVAAGVRLAPRAAAAYVTPSHQFPTGVVLTMRRRLALLDWAADAGAWIIEDDYDSEFRFAGPPLTALAGLGGERTLYVGTFSKTLFPGLRLGYLAVPPAAVPRLAAARAAVDRFPPAFMQDAVADFMVEGGYDAHLRRLRRRYLQARDAVAAALLESAEGALRLPVPPQGLHMVATLPAGSPPGTAAAVRAAADVECKLLSETRLVTRDDDGFVLGFSGHDLADMIAAARRLGAAARTLHRR